MRFKRGPEPWQKKGLYAVETIGALLGIIFTALAASMGAELMVGRSALERLYSMLNFSWKTFLVRPLEIEVTAALVIVGVVLAPIIPMRKAK